VACMKRFSQPDPYSRSSAAGGARLVLLDEHRDWGWQIVNHQSYREKARKAAYDSTRVESGENKKRMEERKTRDDPRSPATTRADPLSDSDSDSDSDSEKIQSQRRASRLPTDFTLTSERRLVAEAEKLPAERTFAKFCDHWRAASGAKARKHDWDATWRNWCRTEVDRVKPGFGGFSTTRATTRKLKTADEIEAEERARGDWDAKH
jgi:hypothetical protein